MSQTSPRRFDAGRVDIGGETIFGSETANYDYFRCDPPGFGLTQAPIRLTYQRQGDYEEGRVVGTAIGTITLTREMAGFDGSVRSSVDTSESDSTQVGATDFDHYINMLASALGNVQSGGYSATETSSTTSILKDTDVSTFTDGQGLAWNTTDYGYQAGWATDVDTAAGPPEEITLLQTAVAVPSDGKIWGGHTVYLKRLAPPVPYLGGNTLSWSIKLSGAEDDDLIKCYGCQLTGLKWTWTVGETPKEEMTFSVASWDHVSTGALTAVGTNNFTTPEKIAGGWASWGTSATRSLLLSGLEIDFGLEFAPVPSIAGEDGIGGWVRTKATPKVTFQLYRDYGEEITDWESQNGKSFVATIGSQPGKMISVCMPKAYVVDLPVKTRGGDGTVMSPVTLEAGYYAGDNDAESDSIPSNTDFRVAFL